MKPNTSKAIVKKQKKVKIENEIANEESKSNNSKRKTPCQSGVPSKRKKKNSQKPTTCKIDQQLPEEDVEIFEMEEPDRVRKRNEQLQQNMETECETNEVCNSELLESFSMKLNDAFQVKNVTFNDTMPDLRFDANLFNLFIIDEVCLEGLDGITLEALWKRLTVACDLPIFLLRKVKLLIWAIIRRACNDLQIFELETPRSELIILNRFENIDANEGSLYESGDDVEDIYPHCAVSDKVSKNMGSCSVYYARRNITDVAKKFTLSQAEQYGNRLIIVANQKLRYMALLQPMCDPNIELTDLQYCILERIGRARKHGEVSQGKHSLKSIMKDAKSLFYNRKILHQNRLILKQLFFSKTRADVNSSGSLFHLYRFLNENKLKSQIMIENVVNYLKDKPGYRMEYMELRKAFGNFPFGKLLKSMEFQRFVKTDVLFHYRDLYPDAKEDEWKNRSNNLEKKIRGIELIDPNINITASWCDPENDMESSDDEEENTGNVALNRTMLNQVYDHLFETPNGMSVNEIQAATSADFYTSRAFIKSLEKRNVLDVQKVDNFRQHIFKYYPRCLNDPHIAARHKDIVAQMKAERDVTEEGIAVMSGLFVEEKENQMDQPDSAASDTENGKWATVSPIQFFNFPSKLMRKIGNKLGCDIRSSKYELDQYKIDTTSNICVHIPIVKEDEPKNTRQDTNFHMCYRTNTVDIYRDDDSHVAPIPLSEKVPKRLLIEALIGDFTGAMEKIRSNEVDDLTLLKQFPINLISGIPPQIPASPKQIIASRSKPVVTFRREKFMGDVPVQFCKYFDEDNVEIDIIASTEPEHRKPVGALYKPSNRNISLQYIKRANFIINLLNHEKVIATQARLGQSICHFEAQEGYEIKVDRKSLERIYETLLQEGFMRILKLTMRNDSICRMQTLMCYMEITPQNSALLNAIQQLKVKYFIPAKKRLIDHAPSELTAAVNNMELSTNELKTLNCDTYNPPYKPSHFIGKEYGYCAKFMRMQVLHELMFYMVYDYSSADPLPVSEVKEMLEIGNIHLSDDEFMQLTPVYKEIGWRMFVPPLPKHEGWSSGWVLLCDILLRLPLSLFVKLHNVRFIIPELKSYVKHPIKKHFLVKYLPHNIRSALLYKRKYLYDIYESLCRLCYAGIVQFGTECSKEKEQIFTYLNRKAILYDTTSSNPGYHQVSPKEYKKIYFNFKSAKDIEHYWYQMWSISMHTPLGQRGTIVGTEVVIENVTSKQVMTETLKPKDNITVVKQDVGYLPGDHLGAAGLDSTLWSHLKRNWMSTTRVRKPQKRAIHTISGLRKTKMEQVQFRPIRFDQVKRPVISLDYHKNLLGPSSQSANERTLELSYKRKKKTNKKSKSKKPAIRKIVMQRKANSKRIVYYDKIDKEVLKRTHKLRAHWSQIEDYLLRLLKIAALYICPHWKRHSIPYYVIRDVIHRVYPPSRNKTSRACQRRINYLFRTPQMTEGLKAGAANLNKITYLTKFFKKLKDRYAATVKKLPEEHLIAAYIYIIYYILSHRDETDLVLSSNFSGLTDYLTAENIPLYYNTLKRDKQLGIYSDPENRSEVMCDTVKSVIHSALSCETNVTLSYQLLKVYQCFPEHVLIKALKTLREQQFISLKKTYGKQNRSKNAYFSSTPFQFSCTYTFSQLTVYSTSAFINAYDFLLSLYKYLEKTSLNEEKRGYGLGMSESTTYIATEFNFIVPEEGVLLNPDVSDHSELIKQLALRYQCYISQKSNDLTSEHNSFKRKRKSDKSESTDDLVSKRNEETLTIEEIMEGMMVKGDGKERKIPYVTDLSILLVRGLIPELDPKDDSNWIEKLTQNHFILNPPEVHLRITENLTENELMEYFENEHSEVIEKLLSQFEKDCIITRTQEEIPNEYQYFAKVLTEFIQEKGELGVTVSAIKAKFKLVQTEFLAHTLLILKDLGTIVQVGITSIRYVHWDFKQPWIINTYVLTINDYWQLKKMKPEQFNQEFHEELTASSKIVKVTPWIKVDGVLNFDVLKSWLTLILSHCMRNPFLSVFSLISRFTYLKPVDIFTLLEYLQDLGCLQLVIYHATKSSLFSEPSDIKLDQATFLDNFEDVYVDIVPTAAVRLGSLLYTLDKQKIQI